MQKSRHKELETLEKELDSNYRDPAFSLAFISYTYEGFGVGFSNIAAAAAYGLRIPLVPVYLVGIFVGVSYLLVEIRSTLNDLELQQRRLQELERKMITSNYCTYLSFTIPYFEDNKKVIDITTLLRTHNVEEITHCLGHYYQQVKQKLEQHSKLSSVQKRSLLDELNLKYVSEVSQFKNPSLVQIFNKACGTDFFIPPPEIPQTRWQRFLTNLRKYYKSSLTGAATAGGVTIFILTTALTTSTVTALFPWSLLGISLITILGAVVGYKIDKYLDRKRKHKNNLKATASFHLTLKNQHRVAELFRSTIQMLNELELHSNEAASNEPGLGAPAEKDNPAEKQKLSDKDYCEVAELRSRSHTYRRASDFILPTLLLARGGFAAISSLFAGISFAGLVLPLTPVFITGGCLLLLHIIFKIWNNWVKHQSEFQAMNALNLSISAEKVHYWQSKAPNINVEQEIKEKTALQILEDLKADYEQFKTLLKRYKESDKKDQKKYDELNKIHQELLTLFSAYSESVNSEEVAKRLATTACYVPMSSATTKKIITFYDNVNYFFSPILHFIAFNFKDVIQGIAFGFGLSLTIFLILGITSIVAIEAGLILGLTSLAGVAMKVAIRYGIKAYRNDHLATIETAGKSIEDKESLWDCRVETKIATERAQSIIDQPKYSSPAEENVFIKEPSWSPSITFPKSRPPLQWYHSDSKNTPRDDSYSPSPRDFVC